MKAGSSFLLAAGFVLMSATIPALAHHSFAAEYDANKPVTISGTVTKIEWMNPHARFYLDVKDESGTVVKWEFELGSPNGLLRRGWTRNALKIGDSITVNGYLAKDGSHLANARLVTLPDGRKVFAGSSFDGGPAK
jgi:DNA/RNA endonuclease YhcR with UshA esterase domain